MADTVKEKYTLQLIAEFVDGDTRTIALDNPNDSLTAQDIDNLSSLMVAGLVGDKTGAQFYRWKSAAKVNKQTIDLDISGT